MMQNDHLTGLHLRNFDIIRSECTDFEASGVLVTQAFIMVSIDTYTHTQYLLLHS
jgi:hypothetical protein